MQKLLRRQAIGRLALLLCIPALVRVAPSHGADRAPLAIKGYDPVAYFTVGKPVQGRADLEYEWDERQYRFSTTEHRDRFKADPLRYAPQFPDFCTMSLTRGQIVVANPEYWLISDGKLYMFAKPVGQELFNQNRAENTARANQNRALVHNK